MGHSVEEITVNNAKDDILQFFVRSKCIDKNVRNSSGHPLLHKRYIRDSRLCGAMESDDRNNAVPKRADCSQ